MYIQHQKQITPSAPCSKETIDLGVKSQQRALPRVIYSHAIAGMFLCCVVSMGLKQTLTSLLERRNFPCLLLMLTMDKVCIRDKPHTNNRPSVPVTLVVVVMWSLLCSFWKSWGGQSHTIHCNDGGPTREDDLRRS